jgi:predicted  nucleic acid-binding Zn-ribbon protein
LSTRFNSRLQRATAWKADEYASLERTEAHEAALAETRAQVEQLAAGVDAVRTSVAARQQAMASELAGLDAERERVRAALDSDLLARFDRIASGRGTGIARAENQQCTAAVWGCARKSGTSSARANCSVATVAAASFTGILHLRPHLKRRNRS